MAFRWRTAFSGFTAAVVGLGLAVVTGTGPATAAPTDLFFSEYIEGSSNNKTLEIYNGTASAVNLATAGYSVQMFFNGSVSAGLTINLTGTVGAGDVYVLAHSAANAAILAEADQTNGSGWYNGDDAVVLRRGTTTLDVIGQIGVDPGTQWGTDLTSTADNTLRRKAAIEAGDTVGNDPFDPAVQWDGFATDDVADLGTHLAPAMSCPDNLGLVGTTIDVPVSSADGNGRVVDIALTSVAPADPGTITRTAFSPASALGGTASATFTASDATPVGVYTLTITATNDDGAAQTATCSVSVGVYPVPVCGDPATPIHDVQGNGAATPIPGQQVEIEGAVIGDHQGAGGFGGYYVQEETPDDYDADPATSEGTFVFDTHYPVAVGDLVRVVGRASEFAGQTQVSSVTAAVVCSSGVTVAPTELELPVPGNVAEYYERSEGMSVHIGDELTATEVFQLGRFGEIDLSVGGRLDTPTNEVAPGGPALALQAANNSRRILLDDGLDVSNPDPVRYPQGGLSAGNPVRVGDTLPELSGVLGYGFGKFRIQPVGPIEFEQSNPRPDAPAEVGGEVRVAAFNVLNYFNGDGVGGGFPTARGAGTAFEFQRQRAKIIAAISELDADVVGLMELENDGTADENPAIEDLVDGLNDAVGEGTYDFIDTGRVGTDAIRVGILYQPAQVSPVGAFEVLESSVDPRFNSALNRPSIAQTFEADDGARFTAVVNHLKSKGSDCNAVGDPDTGDGQGNCNITRTNAAKALADWLATDPTNSADTDFLLLGDMNAYAQEDPITAFRTAGFVDTIDEFLDGEGYSYVFEGQSGYLDHALASADLAGQVSGVTEWHINADEPIALDYNTNFKSAGQVDSFYAPGPYRSSDHDPVLVGLDLNAPPSVDAGGPYAVIEGGSVTVTGIGNDPDDDALTYTWDLDGDGTFETAGPSATFAAGDLQAPGSATITVRVSDPSGLTATDTAVVEVIWDFSGFFGPITNLPQLTTVNAGSAVPVKFSLAGDQGLAVLAADSPTSTPISCTTGAATGPAQQITLAEALSYQADIDTYSLAWKTNKSWTGCRLLTVTLADGTVHEAAFQFIR